MIIFLTNNDLVKLKKMIKKDNDISQLVIPQKLKLNEFLIGYVNESDQNDIFGFILFGIYDDLELNCKYIGINYSYTFIKHRNKGTNTKLRLFIEKFALDSGLDIQMIKSIGLPGSESIKIMKKLGYELFGESDESDEFTQTYFCKKII